MITNLLVYDKQTKKIVCMGDSEDVERTIGINKEHIFNYWKTSKEYLGRYLIYRSGFKEKREMNFVVKDTYDNNKIIFKGDRDSVANYLDMSEGYIMSASRYGIVVKKQYRIERI